ncbi:MAG TPA: DUF3850 domain-containing protein [Candidatus Nanoarchaeia archaeon]|nr:DUF3850 domain-containing protein [Candidatus Nanoarchaeia archaeon]
MRIEKKCWLESFARILSGEKTIDLRLADWECKPGDILVLREYDPEKKVYTGRVLEKEVAYVMKTKGQPYFKKEDVEKYGFIILSLK